MYPKLIFYLRNIGHTLAEDIHRNLVAILVLPVGSLGGGNIYYCSYSSVEDPN